MTKEQYPVVCLQDFYKLKIVFRDSHCQSQKATREEISAYFAKLFPLPLKYERTFIPNTRANVTGEEKKEISKSKIIIT
jgi:hypothetical protein